LALWFAKSSLTACERNGLSEVVHTANEAMARAYAVAKDYKKAKGYLSRARRQLQNLTLNREDRKVYLEQIREMERLVRRQRTE
jgi:hypothetical protein